MCIAIIAATGKQIRGIQLGEYLSGLLDEVSDDPGNDLWQWAIHAVL